MDRMIVSEEKREQIYEAAVNEFRDKGFRGASMDQISAGAGVSKRTVYKYFKSKEKLFQEMMRRHWSKFALTLEVKYDKRRNIRDQLMELGRAQGRLFSSQEAMTMSRLVMSEVIRSPELVEKSIEKTDYKIHFEAMLSDASADGQLSVKNPRVAAEEFISLIKGKAFWPVIFGEPVVTPDEMEEIVKSSVDLIMSGYAGKN